MAMFYYRKPIMLQAFKTDAPSAHSKKACIPCYGL
jgi:hypothetical protein